MSEFEIARDLRALATTRTPQRDLWPSIEARIGAATQPAPTLRARRWWPLAAAASVLLSATLAAITWSMREQPAAIDVAARITPQVHASAETSALRDADPRLAGAIVVLDAAQDELERALERRPDAVFLVGLLHRTNMRRLKLDHYGVNAG